MPTIVAAASRIRGSTIRWRACSGDTPVRSIAAAASHSSPQWYQVCTGNPGIAGESSRPVDRFSARRGQVRPEDRVVADIEELDRLVPVARARGDRRRVEQPDRDEEEHRRGAHANGLSVDTEPERRTAPADRDREHDRDRDRDEDAPAGGRDRRPGGGKRHEAERQPDTQGLASVSVGVEQPDTASDQDPDKHEQQPGYTGERQGYPHPPVPDRSRQIGDRGGHAGWCARYVTFTPWSDGAAYADIVTHIDGRMLPSAAAATRVSGPVRWSPEP